MDTSVASSDHRPRFLFGRLQLKAHGGLLALPATVWLFLFFLIPLLIVFAISFMDRGRGGTVIYDWSPESLRRNFDENYTYVTTNEAYQLVLKRSLNVAFKTTAWCLVLGYPLAFFISTRRNRWVQQISLFLVILPFWTNFVVRTYAWRTLLSNSDDGLINHLLLELGLISQPLELLFTERAVTIGMVYGYLPFMVLPIYAAIERFDFKLVEAAHDLGGNDWTAFWRIIFPLTLPGVIAGSILVFIPALGTYVTADMLGGTRGRMIGSLIYGSFRGTGNWTRGAATSMVMMAIVAVVLVIYALVAQRTENTPRQAAKRRSADVLSRSYALIAAMIAPITGAISHQVTLLSDELTRRRQVFWLKPELRMKRDLLIRKIAPIAIWANAAFCYIFLWVPIIILVVYSFNDANSTVAWRGFTTSWYSKLLSGGINVDADLTTELLLQSIKVSLIVGVAATLISTIVGMMVSLSMARSRFIGKRPLEGLLYLPVGIPEITQGISLLVFFNIAFDYLAKHWDITMRSGYTTLILSHVAFCIPFVAIVVRARLANMNPHFEEAARDLGANEWRTFWRVTFPLMLPGVIAGALLAFTLSLDDFIISEFTKGLNTSTLTVVVYSMAKRSVTPQINAISTLMILVSTLLVGLSLVLQGRSAGRT